MTVELCSETQHLCMVAEQRRFSRLRKACGIDDSWVVFGNSTPLHGSGAVTLVTTQERLWYR